MILSVPKSELAAVTPQQDRLICGMVKRIEAGNTRFDDVSELDRWGYPGCYRWKPPTSLRYLDDDLEFRVVFRWVRTAQGRQMEILSIGNRTVVYDRFKARERARRYAR